MEVKFIMPTGEVYTNKNSHVLILLPDLLEENINKVSSYYSSNQHLNQDLDVETIIEKVKILSSDNLTVAYDLRTQAFMLVKTYEVKTNKSLKQL